MIRFFGRRSKSGPEREHPYHMWIKELIDQGEYAIASDMAGDWLNSNPLDIWAWFYKGLGKTGLSKYQEAIDAFERVIAIEGRSELAWNNKGFALGCLGRYQEAIEAFDKVIAGGFNSGTAWSNKGYVLYQLGKLEEALAAFNKAVANSENLGRSNNSELLAGFELGGFWGVLAADDETYLGLTDNASWNNQGYVLEHMGKFEEATKAFDRATKFYSHDDVAWTNKGYALYQMGKFEEATKAFDRALEIYRHQDFAHYKKADCLLSLGRTEEAARVLNDAAVVYKLGLAQWGNQRFPAELRDRLTDAVQVLDRALRVFPHSEMTWTNKGSILAQLKRITEAEECFRRASECSFKPSAVICALCHFEYSHSITSCPECGTPTRLTQYMEDWEDYVESRLLSKGICPCCGYRTFSPRRHEVLDCEICQWQDEGEIYEWAYYGAPDDGPNNVSLYQAQRNFLEFGAKRQESIRRSRKPRENERKSPDWRLLPPFDGFEEFIIGLGYQKRPDV